MPLTLVRSRSNASLWSACCERFLDELGGHSGPGGYASFLWLVHRRQRDAVLEAAAGRGMPGWLGPPVAFFSELRDRFRIERRPIGILTGRLLVARLALTHGPSRLRQALEGGRGPARAHMLDGVFSELLPEGVTPEELRATLGHLGGDEYAAARNAWVADTYSAFLAELEARGRYDPRSIHALVAERIEGGALSEAIGGAGRLHIYGLTSLRGRRRLFRALTEQQEVDVQLYLPAEDEPSEWDELAVPGETVATPEDSARASPEPETLLEVQPAPDAIRELEWVASRVKRLIVEEGVEPRDVAVIARTGRSDTRRAFRALQAVGVPATARLRTVLARIPALRAVLELLRGEASGWGYRPLRQVLGSPYFGFDADLAPIDWIARQRRVSGLQEWASMLVRLRDLLGGEEGDRGSRRRRAELSLEQVERQIERFAEFRSGVSPFHEARPEGEWIDLTLDLFGGRLFDFRRRLSLPVGDRYDVVRLDQRGVLAVESLLREWRELVDSDARIQVSDWHARLRHLLEANDLALSTPLREGVQVLEAHEAALTPFAHAFVIHANEGEFPREPSGIGVFSDQERARLRELGLPLSDRDQMLRRERSLWRAVTAGPRVTLTYRTTDAAGVPRLPSLMVPEHDPATEIPRTLDPGLGGDAGTKPGPPPTSRRQLLERDVLRLARIRRGGDEAPFATSDPQALRHAVLAAFAEELRTGGLDEFPLSLSGPEGVAPAGAGREPPDDASAESVFGIVRPHSERPSAWNGLLRDPWVRRWLESRYGDDATWSASRLELYSRRPFDFLLEAILRLEEAVEAEEETSPLAFGSVAHRLLERFYGEADPLPAAFDSRAQAVYGGVCARVFEEVEADLDQWLGLPPIWEARKEDVSESVQRYLEWELEHLRAKNATPLLVEFVFGEAEGKGAVPIAVADPKGRGTRLLLRGRIDRVDRYGGEGGWLRVIDYKSSAIPSPGGYADGVLLQTALYMRALESLGHADVRSGVYRSIRSPQVRGVGAELKADGVEDVLRFAAEIPARIRAGLFEAVQARTLSIREWQPGRELTRSEARITTGSRYDPVLRQVEAGRAGGRASGAGRPPGDEGPEAADA